MIRAMVFIDGTWLQINISKMAREEGINAKEYRVHFGNLLDALKDCLAQSKELRLEAKEIDIVRPYIFGHVPVNVDPRDKYEAASREMFYDIVQRDFGYDADLVEVDYGGRRLFANDRLQENPNDEWHPREKRVDVALASAMLYYAAIPYAYDIAIAVIGDEDYVPVLQRVRSLGRRVAIASIRTKMSSPCSRVYSDEYDSEGVRDFDIIWLNNLVRRIEIPERIIQCEGPHHQGRRQSVTRALALPGKPELCDNCRDVERLERGKTRITVFEKLDEIDTRGWPGHGGLACGVVSHKGVNPRGAFFGFLVARVSGQQGDYYFTPRDLEAGLTWDDIPVTEILVFRPEVKAADARVARNVRRPTDSDWAKIERAV